MIELMVPIVRAVRDGSTEYKVGRGPHILPLVEISVLFYDMQRSMPNQNHQTSRINGVLPRIIPSVFQFRTHCVQRMRRDHR